MTNDELLNMFAGQAMQALLQKDGLAADKERICKNAWMVARMMVNTKDSDKTQSEKINVSGRRVVFAPDFTISDDNEIKVGNVVRVRDVNSHVYGIHGEVIEVSGNQYFIDCRVFKEWYRKDQLEIVK